MTFQLLMLEFNQTVSARLRRRQLERDCYLPFGGVGHVQDRGQLAFIGQWRSPSLDLYLLGHGRRGYLPCPGRFLQPDRHSPFGIGGLNAYAYCAADPVNRTDPSGAAFTALIVGSIVIGATSATLQASLVATRSVKDTPARMMWGMRLGIVAGLASMVSGIAAGVLGGSDQTRAALTWGAYGLAFTSAALRLSVSLPALYRTEPRKVVGRLLGIRRGAAPGRGYVAALRREALAVALR